MMFAAGRVDNLHQVKKCPQSSSCSTCSFERILTLYPRPSECLPVPGPPAPVCRPLTHGFCHEAKPHCGNWSSHVSFWLHLTVRQKLLQREGKSVDKRSTEHPAEHSMERQDLRWPGCSRLWGEGRSQRKEGRHEHSPRAGHMPRVWVSLRARAVKQNC
jgi:hypothetical protein